MLLDNEYNRKISELVKYARKVAKETREAILEDAKSPRDVNRILLRYLAATFLDGFNFGRKVQKKIDETKK